MCVCAPTLVVTTGGIACTHTCTVMIIHFIIISTLLSYVVVVSVSEVSHMRKGIVHMCHDSQYLINDDLPQ